MFQLGVKNTCVCGKETNRQCNKCRGQYYCSSECQKKDWPRHKPICDFHVEQSKQLKKECDENDELYDNWYKSLPDEEKKYWDDYQKRYYKHMRINPDDTNSRVYTVSELINKYSNQLLFMCNEYFEVEKEYIKEILANSIKHLIKRINNVMEHFNVIRFEIFYSVDIRLEIIHEKKYENSVISNMLGLELLTLKSNEIQQLKKKFASS